MSTYGTSMGGTEKSQARRKRDARRKRAQERAWEARSGPVTVRKAQDPLFDRLRARMAVCECCAAMPDSHPCDHCGDLATEVGLLGAATGSQDDAIHVHLCRACTIKVGQQVGPGWVRGE